MIHTVEGDILLSKSSLIAHGVAPHDHFNQGLALALREAWPAMYKDFRHYCHTTNPEAGNLWSWASPTGQRIVSMFTQTAAANEASHPGNATLSNVHQAIKHLRHVIEKENPKSVALPRLATGVGRLAWNDVKSLIEKELGDLKTHIFVYETFRSGVTADECLKCENCKCKEDA